MGKIKVKKYFSKDILIAQIDEILRQHDLNQAEFNAKIGVAQAITKWKAKQTPSAESLLAIKKVFGISIDQLLTGEAPLPTLQDFASEPYDGRPLEALETELLFQVLEQVEETVIRQRQKLSVKQTCRLAALVYDHCRRERDQPSSLLIEKYLLLTD